MAKTPLESASIRRTSPFRPRWAISGRTHMLSVAIRASQSMEERNRKGYKELGLFSLKKKIEDAVSRAEMKALTALEAEEAKRIKQEEILLGCDLWGDLARSSESLAALADAIKSVKDLKELRYKAEEAMLITQLAEMDVINDRLFKQAYRASVDVNEFLDHYEMSKLLSGPFNKKGACVIITAGPEGFDSEIWAEKLLSMYTKWSRKHGFEGRVIEKYLSNGGGVRLATIEFETEYVYGFLCGERGTHKMLRNSLDGSIIRETCSAGVDVIPIFLDRALDLHIDDKDLEICFQTSKIDDETIHGTKPAVSIRHIPSGITVQCSDERNHFANKMKALNRLKAKLLVLATEQGVSDVNKIKRHDIATEWKNEVRRYMFRPHKLVHDVRTGVRCPDLNSVLDGNIEPLIRAHISYRLGREVE